MEPKGTSALKPNERSTYADLSSWPEGEPCEPYVAPLDVFLPGEDWVRDRDGLGRVDKVVQPDLVVVCDRDKLVDEGILGAPDLIVEILSPATAYRDMTEKRILYEKHRVREYWIVNPDTLEAQIYIMTDSAYGLPGFPGARHHPAEEKMPDSQAVQRTWKTSSWGNPSETPETWRATLVGSDEALDKDYSASSTEGYRSAAGQFPRARSCRRTLGCHAMRHNRERHEKAYA